MSEDRDRDYENQLAHQARERDRIRKHHQLQELQKHRARTPLHQRLYQAVRRIPPDGLPAHRHSPTHGRGGTGDHAGPPRTDGRAHEVQQALALIEHHVRTLERIGDEEHGLLTRPPEGAGPGHTGGMMAGRMMTTEERDRIVFDEFQGVRAEVVAREAPYLGTSERTIMRARKNEADRRGLRVRLVDGVILGGREEAA